MSHPLKEWMEDNASLFRYSGELGCMREEAARILLSGSVAAFLSPLFRTIYPESHIEAVTDDESVIREAMEEDPALEIHAMPFSAFSGSGFDIAVSLIVPSFLDGRDLISYLFSMHEALGEGGNLHITFLSDDKPYFPMKEEALWYDESEAVSIKRYRPEDFLRALSMVGFDIRAIESDKDDKLGTVISIHAVKRA